MRAFVLCALALAGCDQLNKGDQTDVQLALRDSERAVEIEQLKAEVRALKEENARQDIFAVATYNGVVALQNQVNSNAKIANAGSKLQDDRWAWVTNHVAH